ncbi:hypothetical protein PI125_g22653 [Phytophthora idaei]|nr:hypothetical protein PI125_g22653 [Phytophthora idaei]
MHKRPVLPRADEESPAFEVINTPSQPKDHVGGPSVTSLADAEYDLSPDALIEEYHNSGPLVTAKYIALRIAIVVILLIIAIIFKDHFVDFTDFVGAWAVSMACIILPIFFYLKVFWNRTPWYEKAIGAFIIVVCTGLGGYVTYTTGKNLFLDIVSDKTFQYCPAGFDMVVYTNETFYGSN